MSESLSLEGILELCKNVSDSLHELENTCRVVEETGGRQVLGQMLLRDTASQFLDDVEVLREAMLRKF